MHGCGKRNCQEQNCEREMTAKITKLDKEKSFLTLTKILFIITNVYQ